jgi:hypothetical protein
VLKQHVRGLQGLFGLSSDWTRQERGNGSLRANKLENQAPAMSAAAWFADTLQFMPQVHTPLLRT